MKICLQDKSWVMGHDQDFFYNSLLLDCIKLPSKDYNIGPRKQTTMYGGLDLENNLILFFLQNDVIVALNIGVVK